MDKILKSKIIFFNIRMLVLKSAHIHLTDCKGVSKGRKSAKKYKRGRVSVRENNLKCKI